MRTKKVITFALVLVLLLAGCAKKDAHKDFRNVNWGVSPSAVDKSEETEYTYSADDLLMYRDAIGDNETVDIIYNFKDSKLTEGQVMFVVGERILRDLMASYDNITQQLSDLYGDPLNPEKKVWLTDDADARKEDDHVAIYYKSLMYLLEWETETTYVKLVLECGNQDILTYYYYACDIALRP